jgi:SNF2 family DNA or RNA helicase
MAEVGRCRERIEFSKAEAMAELALGHLSENKSVVIFCNFTSARERIGKFLADNQVPYGEIYGGQKDEDRQACIDKFQENTLPVMIVMTAAGGAALSLHDTRHERPRVSLITPSFNAAEVRQALGRIRRCNGTNVEQYFVLAAKTIEDRVSVKLEAKLNNIDTLNDNDLEV